jgi:voltage-gated potassium channel
VGPEEAKEPIGQEIEQGFKRYRPLQTLFLWDVVQDKESRPALYWALGTLLTGTVVYHLLEGWSYLDSVYFCTITLATVGYGDLTPTTPEAKVFTIFYIINGVVILLALFDRIRTIRERNQELRRRSQTKS